MVLQNHLKNLKVFRIWNLKNLEEFRIWNHPYDAVVEPKTTSILQRLIADALRKLVLNLQGVPDIVIAKQWFVLMSLLFSDLFF